MATKKDNIKPPPKIKGEPVKWHHFFVACYLPQEPGRRTVDAAWRSSSATLKDAKKPASSAWYRAAKKYKWVERAEEWAKRHRQELIASLLAERTQDHRRRIDSLKAARARILEALVALEVEEAKWGQIIHGLIGVNAELRKEYAAAEEDEAPATLEPSARASDLDNLTDDQLDAIERAAQIIESNNIDMKHDKSSNLIQLRNQTNRK